MWAELLSLLHREKILQSLVYTGDIQRNSLNFLLYLDFISPFITTPQNHLKEGDCRKMLSFHLIPDICQGFDLNYTEHSTDKRVEQVNERKVLRAFQLFYSNYLHACSYLTISES